MPARATPSGHIEITPASPLSERFVERARAAHDAVSGHAYFARFLDQSLSRAQIEKGLLGFYPLVQSFPRYMAMVLARIDPHERPRAAEGRTWLVRNISVEERHRDWWIDLGAPFGLDEERFGAHRPSAAMDALNHYLFHVGAAGSIAEAIAAVNYAVEGATGVWTRAITPASVAAAERLGIAVDERALRWLRVHADYDDHHPVEALEIVKIYARDDGEIERAAAAAVRSLEYYCMALDDALAG